MIAIIPYQNDHHNGTELLYAIRSMVKHFRSMTGLIVVGDKPIWLKPEYNLPMKDIILRREYSMYNKAMAGAKHLGIETFLYTTDDHFALKDFDESLPNYHNGTCGHKATYSTSGRYKKLYQNCPEDWLNYDIHVPIVMKRFTWNSRSLETDTPIKTTYANTVGVEGQHAVDCKFFNGHSYEAIRKVIDGRKFFSTSPFCMNKDMMQVMRDLYPEKSKYEK